ncbi:M20 family metallopeptidase [Sporosarcina ureilytica]|uniref:Amidohydrolase n=1 Tax=Sporosarcina ureilytica TaxID=298596 RepID=A0A1D8JFA9_9BACL|nr:M20 family metallopeptidase [Sporosarcina ureilytica]AOV07397.1 amidohydrolase [Sporosarcina ureilytica]
MTISDVNAFVKNTILEKSDVLKEISDFIWEHPETRFEEYKSANHLMGVLEAQGFTVEKNVAGMSTAFIGSFGAGSPVIGFLGEFDALSGLSQKGLTAKQESVEEGGNGHGCGHNLLGTGALAAAIAVKEYLRANNLPGTVQYFGCPGEEGGSGKTFMAREGAFDHLDLALTWHPSSHTGVMSKSSLANYQVFFRFKGISSHAAASPHLGRSALDAVELMNVGVNYLREHVKPDARFHYAVTNTGGASPNVVQADAEVLYLIRSPQLEDVESIYQRICKIAEGAALMTETSVSIEIDKACSNYMPNRSLERIMHRKLKSLEEDISYSDDEIAYAKDIWDTLNEGEQRSAISSLEMFGMGSYEDQQKMKNLYISDFVSEYTPSNEAMPGSTDVGDVSWAVPTAQCTVATYAVGTPFHSWQMVTQGVSTVAHQGMLRAGMTMALTAIEVLAHPEKLEEIKAEHKETFKDNPYKCPIPKGVQPSALK